MQSLLVGRVYLPVVHLGQDGWQPSNLLDSDSRFHMHGKRIPVGVSCHLYHRLRFWWDNPGQSDQAAVQRVIPSPLYEW